MLTPQNVSLHSEGAALLLVWAANLVKLYACAKKLGEKDPQTLTVTPLNLDDVNQISAHTQMQVKRELEARKYVEKEEQQQKPANGRLSNLLTSNQKNIGHFLPNK